MIRVIGITLFALVSCLVIIDETSGACPPGIQCPNNGTCCAMSGGETGCCPFSLATCCQDKLHCCPEGFSCDATGNCLPNTFTFIKGSICPDQKSSCPTGQTCCQESIGIYGCCPLPNAVCCSDGKHCCPSNTVCDLAHENCIRQTHQKKLKVKASLRHEVETIEDVACDSQYSCPDQTTCCTLPNGSWGCCPYPSATCCGDHLHCCPNGYTCGAERCKSSVSIMTQYPAFNVTLTSKVGSVVCPGGSDQCPDGNTCCKLVGGEWGCCPLPEAVCCDDGEHCCPNGSICSGGKCHSDDTNSIPWSKKVKATPLPPKQILNGFQEP